MSRLFLSLWLAVCALVVAPLVGAQNQGDYTSGYVSYPIPYSGACQNARGMAVDSSGYMYVCCGNNPTNGGGNGFIVKMDASGNFVQNITITQNGVNVPYSPFGIAFSGSSMYVTSLYTNMIYVLSTSSYAVTNSWNTYLNWPWGIATDSSSNVWVANYGAGNVLKFNSAGAWQTNFSTTNPAMYYPEEIAIDSSGNVLVVDTDNNRIVKFNSGGTVIATYNNATTNPSLVEPGGIALDSQGSIYVCDTWNYAVIKLNSAGQQVEVLASPLISNGGAKVSAAAGLTIDSSNQVYVVDSISNNRILKFPATLFNSSQYSSTGSNGQSATAAASAFAAAAAAAITLALL